MINEHLEELAALHALGLLDAAGEAELQSAAARDPDVRSLVDSLVETAAALAHDAPLFAPPPELKRDLMRQLPRRQTAGGAKVLSFPVLIPYALAAGLAGLAIWQHGLIQDLDTKLRTSLAEAGQLRQSNSLIAMRLDAGHARTAAGAR
jgi:hypothetical protein